MSKRMSGLLPLAWWISTAMVLAPADSVVGHKGASAPTIINDGDFLPA